jgi:hypothetical protein
MSLYSYEEICKGCRFADFHTGNYDYTTNVFLGCKIKAYNLAHAMSGTCDKKELGISSSNNQEQKTDVVEFDKWKSKHKYIYWLGDNNYSKLGQSQKRYSTSELYTIFKSSVPPSINGNKGKEKHNG